MARTLSEILKEADVCDDMDSLVARWEEIRGQYWNYPLIELRFAHEHITKLSGEMGARHAAIFKPLIDALISLE